MSFISSFDINSIVLLCEVEDEARWPDPKIFLCIPASAPDAAAVNPNGIKALLANGLTFLLVVILLLVMDQEIYQESLLIVLS